MQSPFDTLIDRRGSGALKTDALRERFPMYRNEDGKPERYPMFHIVSPGRLIPTGISIEDLYIPIEEV